MKKESTKEEIKAPKVMTVKVVEPNDANMNFLDFYYFES